MGSGTYKLLAAGALSAVTSCLIFFGVLTFFSRDGIFEFYEFTLSIGGAGIAPYLVSRLLTIKVKFILFPSFVTLFFPVLGPIFGGSGSQTSGQMLSTVFVLSMSGGFFWSCIQLFVLTLFRARRAK
tara:strand:+ start:469 stop:849 length:381 start_codon:yes stop_codon:yes gene_type:complete